MSELRTEVLSVALGMQRVRISFLMHKNWLRTEMRQRINEKVAQRYAALKKQGTRFDVPEIFFDPDTEIYWVGDGFHRIRAEEINGSDDMEVYIRRGKVKDAILKNLERNREEGRGLAMTEGDKTHAAMRMLRERAFDNLNDREIGDIIGCSRPVVARCRIKLNIPHRGKIGGPRRTDVKYEDVKVMADQGFTAREIANKLNVSKNVILSRLREGEPIKHNHQVCPHCNGTGYISESP